MSHSNSTFNQGPTGTPAAARRKTMQKSKLFKLVIPFLLALALVIFFAPARLVGAFYTYFVGDFYQDTSPVTINISNFGSASDQVVWKDPSGNVISYCQQVSCGPNLHRYLDGAGNIISTDYYFYYHGDPFPPGTYSGLAIKAGTELGLYTFNIHTGNKPTATYTPTITPTPGPIIPVFNLDPGFGTGGIVTTGFDSGGNIRALALLPGGRILAAGSVESDFALVRYLSDGSLDPDFGNGGKVTTDLGGDDLLNALAVQDDGSIVAAGYSYHSVNYDFAMVRYTSSGTLDPGFGTGGIVITDFGGYDYAYALSFLAGGKIAVAGSSGSKFALAHYTSTGSLDAGFGTGGKMTADLLRASTQSRSSRMARYWRRDMPKASIMTSTLRWPVIPAMEALIRTLAVRAKFSPIFPAPTIWPRRLLCRRMTGSSW
jgi:uncharacterized delta-60 repeat protein